MNAHAYINTPICTHLEDGTLYTAEVAEFLPGETQIQFSTFDDDTHSVSTVIVPQELALKLARAILVHCGVTA